MVNFTNWTDNFMEYSMEGYTNLFPDLGFIVWAIIFTSIIAYVYLKNESFVAAAAAALILFATFTNFMVGVDIWYTFMHVLVALAVTGLVLVFITKVRR
jgi:heme A synthase